MVKKIYHLHSSQCLFLNMDPENFFFWGGRVTENERANPCIFLALIKLNYYSDLKLKDMNLVEAYKKWNSLLQKMAENKCHGCIKLDEHMKLAKEIFKHKEEVHDLQFQMSDEALKQMPDFQGRVGQLFVKVFSLLQSCR